jgi:hypothetical protein
VIDLCIILFPMSAMMGVVYFALVLIWKGVKTVIKLITFRYFGYRPMIFNRELAELEAKETTEEFQKFFAKPDEEGLSDEGRELWLKRMEEHAIWVIERYTYSFSVSKYKPIEPQRPRPVTEAIH